MVIGRITSEKAMESAFTIVEICMWASGGLENARGRVNSSTERGSDTRATGRMTSKTVRGRTTQRMGRSLWALLSRIRSMGWGKSSYLRGLSVISFGTWDFCRNIDKEKTPLISRHHRGIVIVIIILSHF